MRQTGQLLALASVPPSWTATTNQLDANELLIGQEHRQLKSHTTFSMLQMNHGANGFQPRRRVGEVIEIGASCQSNQGSAINTIPTWGGWYSNSTANFKGGR
jgi:hypothetical protein